MTSVVALPDPMLLELGDIEVGKTVHLITACAAKRLKPLVALLELWWGSKKMFDTPKRDTDFRSGCCSPSINFT